MRVHWSHSGLLMHCLRVADVQRSVVLEVVRVDAALTTSLLLRPLYSQLRTRAQNLIQTRPQIRALDSTKTRLDNRTSRFYNFQKMKCARVSKEACKKFDNVVRNPNERTRARHTAPFVPVSTCPPARPSSALSRPRSPQLRPCCGMY